MGKARGLIAMLNRVRHKGRDLRPLSAPIVGHSKAEARALLLEAITRGPAQDPNPLPCQMGRGRGLGSPSPPCTTTPFAPNTAGLGRARSRTPGLNPCPGTPCTSPIDCHCVCAPRGFS